MRHRVVITGIGVVSPLGIGTRTFWEGLTAGRSATRRISLCDPSPFRSQVGAECDFDPLLEGLTAREVRRLDRAAQFAVVSAREAVASSGIDFDGLDPYRVGVTIGTAVGCSTSLETEYVVVSDAGRLWNVDHSYLHSHLYDQFVPSSIAAELARAFQACGPASVVSTGCTSGLDSVGYAADLIGEGTVDVMIAGSTDAPISPITLASFDAIKASTPNNREADTASRPFDLTRSGLVLGEGAAVFVLEELGLARARGATIFVEVAGFANRCNAYHMTGLRADGVEMATAITTALDEAQLDPVEVDYVNAHGSSTKQNDRHETAAFKRSLGPHAYAIPVSSIKSMIGHSLGAIGSLEIAACAMAIQNNVVPPTANLTTPDPECDLDYTPITARTHKTDVVVTVGSGFGGFQSAMVLCEPERRTT